MIPVILLTAVLVLMALVVAGLAAMICVVALKAIRFVYRRLSRWI